jgi:plastocyanin
MPAGKTTVRRRHGFASVGSGEERAASTPTATTPAPAPAQTLQITADRRGVLRFRPAKLIARAGEVAILMTNPKTSGRSHGVRIIGTDVDVRGITVEPGRLSEAAATLAAGSYAYVCTVARRREAGMRGRLEVR